MSKGKELAQLEDSLREYITEEYKSDAREKDTFNAGKYKGLTITIGDAKKGGAPTFSVQVAMLEAVFSVESGKKIDGGLGGSDERMIEKWLGRGSNRSLMKIVWEKAGQGGGRALKLKPFDSH
ncbi:hypothetical protein tpqmel_0339 [Candidatus Gastranaerophilus sp. (ex Termes propinquus)]|nr:hypothetical protein tpqmel_0339 [Candidatus Gastranaerophilus sp. (ex Termes propinquus)]